MFYNITLANEVVRGYGRADNSPRCTIKVDHHKTFNSISWSFFRRVLVNFNFPLKLVDLIIECVMTTRFFVLVNGGA